MKIGYARVSTKSQSTDIQVKSLEEAGCENIVQDKGDDSKLDLILEGIRSGDTLIVYSLDRLSHSFKEISKILLFLKEKDVTFIAIRESIDTSSMDFESLMKVLQSLSDEVK